MSKTIKILGTGCQKCKTTTNLITEFVKEQNIDAEIIKIEDIMEIMEYNIMTTPAVLVDDKVIIKGRVPNKKELIELFQKS